MSFSPIASKREPRGSALARAVRGPATQDAQAVRDGHDHGGHVLHRRLGAPRKVHHQGAAHDARHLAPYTGRNHTTKGAPWNSETSSQTATPARSTPTVPWRARRSRPSSRPGGWHPRPRTCRNSTSTCCTPRGAREVRRPHALPLRRADRPSGRLRQHERLHLPGWRARLRHRGREHRRDPHDPRRRRRGRGQLLGEPLRPAKAAEAMACPLTRRCFAPSTLATPRRGAASQPRLAQGPRADGHVSVGPICQETDF